MSRAKRRLTGDAVLDRSIKEVFRPRPELRELEAFIAASRHKAVPPIPIPTEVGIEVEIEGVSQPIQNPMYLWKAERDGSLRNNGLELISYPLTGKALGPALAELNEFYVGMPVADFSHRCSIHIHINVSKLMLHQLHSIMGTYLCVENLLFAMVDPSRQGNSYCYPLADTMIRSGDLEKDLNESYKYAALNPHHLKDFGTLEFRHHQGTKDVAELLQWIKVILAIYKYGVDTPYEKVAKTIRELNTVSNYADFVNEVFQGQFPHFIARDLQEDMEHGVTAAKLFLEY